MTQIIMLFTPVFIPRNHGHSGPMSERDKKLMVVIGCIIGLVWMISLGISFVKWINRTAGDKSESFMDVRYMFDDYYESSVLHEVILPVCDIFMGGVSIIVGLVLLGNWIIDCFSI